MTRGGIDVKKFSSHSVRSAAVSKASAKFVSVDKVLKVAGWSNAKTFAKFLKQKSHITSYLEDMQKVLYNFVTNLVCFVSTIHQKI
jgi:predicted chitinase